ncbi:MAG: Na+/H+ antiporter subunit E [Burkholderiaceae bacterium]|nr:Na+/H+ antiporter subunit E [Burkholderiaceae bacterium]MCD6672897.1 Na+/H+ antiporter subunit E [Burkholderiaceae bacterium]
MRRVLPAPLLSLALFVLWLVLARSASVGQLIIATIVAVAMPLLAAPLLPLRPRIRRPGTLARLILRVGGDVVVSSFIVARGALRRSDRLPGGRFVRMPLELRDPHAIAALATITTVIPGTVWTELAGDRSWYVLHVFDLHEDQVDAFVARYKARYEHPLKEIFE